MSYQQPYRIGFYREFAGLFRVEMSRNRIQVAQDFTATVALFFIAILAMTKDYPITSGIATLAIGVINTVTLGQIYSAVREQQAENRDEYREEPREKYR